MARGAGAGPSVAARPLHGFAMPQKTMRHYPDCAAPLHACLCTDAHSLPAPPLLLLQERSAALKAFKEGDVRCLICTDVAARGIDISGLPYVINMTLPDKSEDYIHRVRASGTHAACMRQGGAKGADAHLCQGHSAASTACMHGMHAQGSTCTRLAGPCFLLP